MIIDDMSKLPDLLRINIFDQNSVLKHTSGLMDINQKPLTDYSILTQNINIFDTTFVFQKERFAILKDRKTGRILNVSTPILSEPSCVNAACHIHHSDEKILGLLEVQMSLSAIDKNLKTSELNYLILVSLFIMSVIAVFILYTRQKISKPLTHIVRASNEVAKGNLDVRIPVEMFRLSDVYNVGNAFNNMLEKIDRANQELRVWSKELEEKVREKTEELKRTQNELIHIEKMASLGKLSSSVAHEINNPLSGVLTYTKLVSRQLKEDELSPEEINNALKHLEMIESETKRCGNIVKGLLDFSRETSPKFEVTSLNMFLQETQVLMSHSFKVADIEFQTDFSASEDKIKCNPNQIKQACIAVLVNALEAVNAGGMVTFRSYNRKDSKMIHVEVSDDGVGIRPEDLDHIFEPFFSRKRDGSGSGLGLAVTYGIVQRHNGNIHVKSDIGKGTKFIISFPLFSINKD